jgi:iron complex outermembrane recepter protein
MIWRRIISLLWLILFTHTLAFAQEGCRLTFLGNVTSDSGEPLSGAVIFLGTGPISAVSDESGNFVFKNLCPGKYALVIQYLGYEQYRSEVKLEADLNKTFPLHPEVAQLEEVIVHAHQAQTEHAHNLATITSKQLDESAGKSLGEMLREIPGVNTIQAGPGIFKPVIHGLHSQRILILNYGIRQEGQQWGAEHAPEIDPFIASNIVVIKDATAIKYGTDALGGVIVVNPPDLPEKPGMGGTINAVVQSNGRSGTLSGYMEGGIKNHEGWGWRVQGTGKRAGDFHAPNYSLTNTGVKELNFSVATGLHKPTYGFEIFFSRFETTLGILNGTAISNVQDLLSAMETEPPKLTRPFSYAISSPRQHVSHELVKINAHRKLRKGEWRLQYGHQQNQRKEYDVRRGSLLTMPSIDLLLQTHTLETEWEIEDDKKRTLCVGITGMAQKNTNVPGTQRIPFIPNFASFNAGIFGVTQFFMGRWKMDAGLRYDHRQYQVKGFDYKNSYFDDELSFGNFSVTTGASLPIKKKQTLHFSGSSAWRPPHIAELYSLGTHQSAAAIEYGLLLNDVTNEVKEIEDVSFRNEQAFKFIGTHQYQSERFQNEITAYGNVINHYIYLKPSGITQNIRGVYPYFRYAQTDVLFVGVDMSTSLSITPKLKVKQNASLIRVWNTGGTGKLPFIPPNRFDWSIRFEESKNFILNNLHFEGKAKLVLEQGHAPRVVTPGQIIDAKEQGIDLFESDKSNFDFAPAPSSYFLLGLTTGFSIQTGATKIDFSLAAENLMNTSYREYTNRFRYYADDRGRNFLFSMRVNF